LGGENAPGHIQGTLMKHLSLAAFRRTAVVLVATLLGACGGGDGDPAPLPAPGGTSVGTTGGTVSLSGGPVVLVPAGALASATTIAIEKVTSGAPTMPADLVASGDLYAITPHGTTFQQPATVTLPVPNVALGQNQQLMMAKAEPNGSWVVLGDTVINGSTASATVTEFSYFSMVIINFPLGFAQALPFAFTNATMTCSNQPCAQFIGTTAATYAVTANNGQLPSSCFLPEVRIASHTAGGDRSVFVPGFSGGSATTNFSDFATGNDLPYMRAELWCAPSVNQGRRINTVFGMIRIYPTGSAGNSYPAISVDRMPDQIDVVSGSAATLEAILSGGASAREGADLYRKATPTDRAVMDWQRSDDQGRSWKWMAQSYQDEGNPAPLGGQIPWRHWTASQVFIASSGDHGALMRVIACYTPPAGTQPQPCATGAATRINVIQAASLPAVTSMSESMLVQSGQTATLVAVTSGLPAPTLQWQTRAANAAGAWTNIPGATAATHVTAPLNTADNGLQYRVVATNTLGAANGPIAIVSVSDLAVAPFITTQPANLAVTAGNDAAFAVAARGTEGLRYQWSKGATPVSGATAAVLRLANVAASDAGSYSVTVTNAVGAVTSTAATLSVGAAPASLAPSIVTQPASLTVSSSNSATFAVGVNGTGPFSFQWRRDGAPISGATSAAYTIGSVSAGDAAGYTVVVTNGTGSATSSIATLTLASPDIPPLTSPFLVTSPSTVVVATGASATLAAQATGSAPLSYQWSKGGIPVSGATSAVLVLSPVGAMDAGSYTVTVSNGAGSVTSAAADIILLGVPAITTQPQDITAIEGTAATFSVTATGQGLHYAWLRNGVEITGATGASYSTPALLQADGGAVFSVTVYNGSGLKFSNAARLTVNAAAPSGLSYASPQAYTVGTTITTLNPVVSGTVTGFSVSPALPAGLSLHPATGAISGTPTNATASAAYTVTASNGSGSTAFPLTITVASGVRSWRTALAIQTSATTVGQLPRIAADASGNAIAVWQQYDGALSTIWSSRYAAGTGWDAPAPLSNSANGLSRAPQIGMDSAGNAIVVWAELMTINGGANAILSRAYTVGSGWDAIATLATNSAGFSAPQVAVNASGSAVAAWAGDVGGGGITLQSRTYIPGSGWNGASAVHLNTNVRDYLLAIDGAGNATAAWAESSGGAYDIMGSRYTAGATWGPATTLDANAASAGAPSLAMDSSGNATVVWTQADAGGVNGIWMNRFNQGGAGWSAAAVLTAPVNTSEVQVAIDAAGRNFVAWQDTVLHTFRFQPGGAITSANLDGSFAASPRLAADSNGTTTALWQLNVGSTPSYRLRAASNSGAGWSAAADVQSGSVQLFEQQLAMSADGTAIAVWSQENGPVNTIWANVYR
jgi:hypothetical protein